MARNVFCFLRHLSAALCSRCARMKNRQVWKIGFLLYTVDDFSSSPFPKPMPMDWRGKEVSDILAWLQQSTQTTSRFFCGHDTKSSVVANSHKFTRDISVTDEARMCGDDYDVDGRIMKRATFIYIHRQFGSFIHLGEVKSCTLINKKKRRPLKESRLLHLKDDFIRRRARPAKRISILMDFYCFRVLFFFFLVILFLLFRKETWIYFFYISENDEWLKAL